MKKIKIIGSLVLVFAFVIGGYLLFNKEEYSYYLALGDYVSKNQIIDDKEVISFVDNVGNYLIKENKVNEVNTKYLRNNMSSKKLLEMIEKDSYSLEESKLVDLIKKSKYITISLGLNDVINLIKYDGDKKELVYDKDIVANKVEIFKHNYHQIIEEIKNINKDSRVVLIGNYKLYDDYKVSELLNSAIEEVVKECNVEFVDLIDIKDDYMFLNGTMYLNNYGQEMVSEKVLKVFSN